MIGGCDGESFEQRRAREEATRKEEARQDDEHRQRVIAELAGPRNADVSWSEKPFSVTADVQDRLIRRDKRPIAGIAELVDVERAGAGYLLHFIYGGLSPSVELVLRATQRDAGA
jgi:hypothetical protein